MDQWSVTRKAADVMQALDSQAFSIFPAMGRIVGEGITLLERQSTPGTARVQTTHGDLHFKNVIWSPSHKAFTIIDIDGLGPGIAAEEIVVILTYMLCSCLSQNLGMISTIVRASQGEFDLTPEEMRAIPSLMIVRKLSELVHLSSLRHLLGADLFRSRMVFSLRTLSYIVQQYGSFQEFFDSYAGARRNFL